MSTARVLHISKYPPGCAGGIERFVAELLPAQRRLGLPVGLFAHADPYADPVDDHEWRAATWWRTSVMPLAPFAPWTLAQALKTFAPTHLHLHLPNPAVIALTLSPAARRLPLIIHWHADSLTRMLPAWARPLYPPYQAMERGLLRRARHIVATSHAYLASSPTLREHRSRCVVIPLGLGADQAPWQDAPSWPAAGLRLLFVGRLVAYKGLSVLLEALARVADASLIVAGDGPERTALGELSERLKLQSRVSFLGTVSEARKAALLRDCQALVLPSISREEAFGMVLLEAFRAQRPALASAIAGSGISEVLRDQRCGLLLPAGDISAWAGAIAALARDCSRLHGWGHKAREDFDERFQIGAIAQRLAPLYH